MAGYLWTIKKKMKTVKYYLQKLAGLILSSPIIPQGKSCGFSLVRSERTKCTCDSHSRVQPPFVIRDVNIGTYSYLASNSRVANTTIGKFCSVGPNFCCGQGIHPTEGISTAPMFYSPAAQNGMTLCKFAKVEERKYTVIGNDVFIGANVTVLDGVSIGDGAVIGAGAVVSKDIPPYAIAVGCPIRIIRYRFTDEQISAMLRIQWWNWPEERLAEVEKLFFDIDAFIEKFDSCEKNKIKNSIQISDLI